MTAFVRSSFSHIEILRKALVIGAGLIFAGLLSGCGLFGSPRISPKQKVNISSVPAGARIEINNADVGQTPIAVEIDSTPRGTFRNDTVIRAYPSDTGYIQVKAFNGARWSINDLIPKQISFDTRIDPTMSVKAQ